MSEASVFNPSRLTLARERVGLTKRALAELVDLTPKTISNLEKGEHYSTETVDLIAQSLKYPIKFFFDSDIAKPTEDNASFRSFSRVTATQRNAALAAGAYAFMVGDWLNDNFHLPEADIPDLSGYDPELAAIMLRNEWGLNDRPIRNIIHLLESKGVLVFSLAEENTQVNAFSCWQNGEKPYVFLNSFKSAESSRFDAAHELGHLVLHKNTENKGKEAEIQADTFASEFLMPTTAIAARCTKVKSVSEILKEKQYWFVSAFALAYKLHKTGLMTDWLYRSACIEMSQKGFRKKEPLTRPHERSQVIAKILDQLRTQKKYTKHIAAELQLPEKEVSKLFFNIATVTAQSHEATPPTKVRKPKLHLVE